MKNPSHSDKTILQRVRPALSYLIGGQWKFLSTMPSQARPSIPAITPEEVAEARSFFPLEKFFIFGHARSGTTMLVRLVRMHPQVYCNYQAHFFTRPPFLRSLVDDPEINQWLTRRSNRWNRGQDLSPVILRAAADYILEREARRAGKTIVGDKSPSNLVHGEAVRSMFSVYPDAKLIYIIRDGRDAVLSHRIQSFIEFPEQLSREDQSIRKAFINNPEPFLHGDHSLFTPKGLETEAINWDRNVRETDQLGREIYAEHYFTLRYEDLLDHPWEQMSRLWTFLGANPDQTGLKESLLQELAQNPDAEYQEQKAGQIANAIQKGKRGNWKDVFTQQDQRIFQTIAGDTLSKWGYKQSEVFFREKYPNRK